eukprot:CAMPEP_0174906770 /NCGR_PEP_ID=MMETSP0167-20121228/58313_1 /TAXON_ID=38298 /ORGANISM="Rhodella maculata, Strain CCMP736" /LENGTH=102 /DNA_ID=CAMNT_0016150081 /DNA_START=429 /DNA_END=734 /DNA_ORIENTATION=+
MVDRKSGPAEQRRVPDMRRHSVVWKDDSTDARRSFLVMTSGNGKPMEQGSSQKQSLRPDRGALPVLTSDSFEVCRPMTSSRQKPRRDETATERGDAAQKRAE